MSALTKETREVEQAILEYSMVRHPERQSKLCFAARFKDCLVQEASMCARNSPLAVVPHVEESAFRTGFHTGATFRGDAL